MKRSILLGIVGIAATVATSAYGQGFIQLNNYTASSTPGSPPVEYGQGTGGAVGTAITTAGFTLGLYIGAGNFVGSVGADSTAGSGTAWGSAIPTSLDASFALASGTGSTAAIAGAEVFGEPGGYTASGTYFAGTPGGTFTVMLVAYNGASYAASTIRGHSQAFTMVSSVGTAFAQTTGAAETDGGFQVLQAVPEPTTMALGGLGLAALVFARRKKA